KDGAFYGPKIDFDVTDAIGRKWQCATIQLDYMQPENFDLKYIGADNTEHRPVVIHRAIIGSFERFIAILIEHYAGAFPLWLAPLQAIVLPISDRHLDYARSVRDGLKAAGLRVDLDDRQEKIGYKIREAQLQKVPYMLVVGDRESAEHTVSVRARARGPEAPEGDRGQRDQVPPQGRRARLPVQEEAYRALPRGRRQGEGDDLLPRARDGASRHRPPHSRAADRRTRGCRGRRDDAASRRQPDAHDSDAPPVGRRPGEGGGGEVTTINAEIAEHAEQNISAGSAGSAFNVRQQWRRS